MRLLVNSSRSADLLTAADHVALPRRAWISRSKRPGRIRREALMTLGMAPPCASIT
jgi:hypothetical protein